jgi:large subunit ribosomal protein L11
VKEVIGTCVSLGVTVNGRRPKEIFAAIDAGEFDSALK